MQILKKIYKDNYVKQKKVATGIVYHFCIHCYSGSITVSLSIKTQNAVYGSEVIHTATITSEVPVTTLKWQKGTQELDISPSKYTQSGNGPGTVTLTIKHVDFTDSGNYQVEVSNIAGRTTTSNQVSLTVTGGKAIDDYKQQSYHY